MIRVGGNDVVQLQGTSGLTVGFEVGTPRLGDEPTYTDLAGNPVDPATLDVVINRFEWSTT